MLKKQVPTARSQFEMELQDAIRELSGGRSVVVRDDHG